mgnify:CR=1 FL=1
MNYLSYENSTNLNSSPSFWLLLLSLLMKELGVVTLCTKRRKLLMLRLFPVIILDTRTVLHRLLIWNLYYLNSFEEQNYEINPCVQIMNGPAATTTAEPTEPPTTTQPTTTTSSGPVTAPVVSMLIAICPVVKIRKVNVSPILHD